MDMNPKILNFLMPDAALNVIHTVIDGLENEEIANSLKTGSQIEWVLPILLYALDNGDSSLTLKVFNIFKNWSFSQAPGDSLSNRNKYLRLVINSVFNVCYRHQDYIPLYKITEILERIIFTPPIEYEEETWYLLMNLLPQFSQFKGSDTSKNTLRQLSIDIFACSGLETKQSLQLLNLHKIDEFWEIFVGNLMSGSITPNIVKYLPFYSGVWNQANPMTPEFSDTLLNTLLKRELTIDVRRHCYFGIIKSLTKSKVGLFRFLIPVDTVLSIFADTIFPFTEVEEKSFRYIFELFTYGKIEDNSKWMRILFNSIRKEFYKIIPNRSKQLIESFSNILFKKPRFFVSLTGDIINAILSINDIILDSAEWILLCSNLAEIYSCDLFNGDRSRELFNLLYHKIDILSDPISAVYISLVTGRTDFSNKVASIVGNSFSVLLLLIYGFTAHISPDIVSENLIITLIEHVPQEAIRYILLMMIEVIDIIERGHKNEKCCLCIHDYARKQISENFLRNVLLNLITSPIHLQLEKADLDDILITQRDYFRFNSTIISSNFDDDENAVIVCRNQYSMSAYRLSPINENLNSKFLEGEDFNNQKNDILKNTKKQKSDKNENIEEKPVKCTFTPYKPRSPPTKKRDTFYFLSALGLFTDSNSFQIAPLDESCMEDLGIYEKRVGRRKFHISLARINCTSKGLFDHSSSSDAFNTFTAKLGPFIQNYELKNGKQSSYPVPYFDSILFRFIYFSRYHFNGDSNVGLEETNGLVLFNENGSDIVYDEELFQNWPVVITVSNVCDDLYSIHILKFSGSLRPPLDFGRQRLLAADHIGYTIGFILYLYVCSNIDELYINETEGFIHNSKLFKYIAPVDGLELLSQVFKNNSINGNHS
ncbi:hypothetical protein TRFO_32452 [Tritrichomonas foetus]|uniref:Uncharacterized protein n=1 Tax=Tritrichomonas foetus TaxID=1144522 RepID=A0A1J4JU36_9EUKA|nr:hypothetical protein TRFO_32452 [Tritrichomonas foetus]|eukprot:OHT00765.1 hypothetical protein TRFO_32452 [Tritrichomonas foetus]